MKFNVLEHEMVPEHRLLNDEEAEQLLQRLHITRDQLPKIRKTDAVIRVLERARPDAPCPKCGTVMKAVEGRYACAGCSFNRDVVPEGSIVKVFRLTQTAGVSEAYRLVIGR